VVPLKASKLYIVEGIEEDPLTRERARRLRTGIHADIVEYVGDAELNSAFMSGELNSKRHGMKADIEPVVIFNRFRFDDTADEKKRRQAEFPGLFKKSKLSGYGGIDWRDSGSASYRERTKLVCNPAWQIHTIVGCHFRCAYCHLGNPVIIMMNIEELIDRLDEAIRNAPGQTLYQYDNGTDTVCFEPEYGSAKLLIEYFAGREEEYLELYVGKSDHVDHLLNLDHRGHTVCCWSVSGQTQSTEYEWKTAPMRERIEAARKCQEAGYHIRFRLSPIIPVKNWEDENRELIELIFAETQPDVITFETLRFMNYDAINTSFDTSLLDPEFLSAMEDFKGQDHLQGCQIPHWYREKVYRFIIDELERVNPETPYALCRAPRVMWEALEDDFARHGQNPDYYVCNCGPYSAPGHELLRAVQV
jgi:hypothetical protein